MFKAIKIRLYPSKGQRCLIEQTLGCCRLIYNKGLEKRISDYKNGVKTNYCQTSKMLTELKRTDEFEFLKTCDSVALQTSLKDLDKAFKNFFNKRAKYPHFKSKHNHRQSYRTLNVNNGRSVRVENKHIKLPKVGWVKIRQTVKNANIRYATVVKAPSGKYFAVLTVEFEPKSRQNKGGQVGIDVGIHSYYTDSNGNVAENPKNLKNSLKQLARAQRSLSRKEKYSHNFEKQRIKVAAIYEKVCNRRNDFLQKLSSTLISDNQVICVEGLKVANMMKNHHLAREISDASWGAFRRMLEYKSGWYGNNLVITPTFYPSSQLCSQCGFQNSKVKNLAIREWTCPQCKTLHDRDFNASINILRCGLQMLTASNCTAGWAETV